MESIIQSIKNKYQKIKFINNKFTFFSLLVLNLVLCLIYSITNFGISIPIINAAVFALSIFILNPRYRIYLLLFFVSFAKFFTAHDLNIGSFYSYILLLYDALILIVSCFQKKISFKKMIISGCLAIYVFVISLVENQFAGFFKSVSFIGYVFAVLSFESDSYAKKDITGLISTMLCGIALSNILAFFIIYCMDKNIAINFLNTFIASKYANAFIADNGSFRYPGIVGDPNFLGLYVLFLTAIVVVFYKKLHFKPLIVTLTIFIQVFAFLGLSKTYILVFVVLFALLLVYLVFKKRNLIYFVVPILLVTFFFLVLIKSSLFQSLINRFLFADMRNGFLYAFTTQRSALQSAYCSRLLSDPLHLLFGAGIAGDELFKSAHNFYIMLIWDFGIVGSALYLLYFSSFLKLKQLLFNKFLLLPLIVIFIYGFSLDFVLYSEIIYFSFFILSNYKNVFVDSFEYSEVSI